MKVAKLFAAAAALSMAAAPALAANPAASLSIGKSVRASSRSTNDSQLAGSGVFVAIVAAIAVIAVIIIVADDGNSKSK